MIENIVQRRRQILAAGLARRNGRAIQHQLFAGVVKRGIELHWYRLIDQVWSGILEACRAGEMPAGVYVRKSLDDCLVVGRSRDTLVVEHLRTIRIELHQADRK